MSSLKGVVNCLSFFTIIFTIIQCKGNISHTFKIAKIIVFDTTMCKSPNIC